MSVFMTETYVVRRDRQEAFDVLLQKFLDLKSERPDLFEGVKSWTLRRQDIGQPAGLYAETWEYEDLAAMERIDARVFGDEDMKSIQSTFHKLLVPASFSSSVWSPVA
jgi:hypothetical protein